MVRMFDSEGLEEYRKWERWISDGQFLYFDNENRRSKRIDLDHSHRKMRPHTQHGYLVNTDGKKGASKLTPMEKAMVERVLSMWDNHKGEN